MEQRWSIIVTFSKQLIFAEQALFFKRMKEVGVDGQWGIFSITIPGIFTNESEYSTPQVGLDINAVIFTAI